MDRIGSIEVRGDVAIAYECATQIWGIPPWTAIEAALNGDTSKIEIFTSQWSDDHAPFSGPIVELIKQIRGNRKENLIRITTDTSARVIEIRHGPYSWKMCVNFGKTGSVFAAGDLYARVRELDEDEVSIECWSANGATWQDEWTPKIGMSHSTLATDWAWGKLSEEELIQKLTEVA
jgi:hypothetical protein